MKLPRITTTIGCKWIFEKNEGIPKVEDVRFKARMVLKAIVKEMGWILMKFSLLF